MTYLAYTGTSDFREFTGSDIKSLGVEGAKKHTFARGETMDVDDSIAGALLETYPQDFTEVEEPIQLVDDDEVPETLDEKAKKDLPATTEKTGGAADAPTTSTSSRGSSTRTR